MHNTMLTFELTPSKNLLIIFVLFWFGATSCVLSVPFAVFAKLGLVIICLVHSVFIIRRHVLRQTELAVVKIQSVSNGKWKLYLKNGAVIQAVNNNSNFVTEMLILLNVKSPISNKKYTVLVTPDCLGKDEYRVLRKTLLTMTTVI